MEESYALLPSAAVDALNTYSDEMCGNNHHHRREIKIAVDGIKDRVIGTYGHPPMIESICDLGKKNFGIITKKSKDNLSLLAKYLIGGIQAINEVLEEDEYRLYAVHLTGSHDVCCFMPMAKSNHYRLMGVWAKKDDPREIDIEDPGPARSCSDHYQILEAEGLM